MLYLVRHGRTAGNADGLLQGRLDLPLDETGERQAEAMAAHVRSITVGVDEVWCSSLLRATQTAALYGVEPMIDDRWIEINFGMYEGARMTEMPGAVWDAWREDPDFAPEGAETFGAVAARVRPACEELIGRAVDRDIVVVSHMMPIKTAAAWALDSTLDIIFRSHLSQGSLCRISAGNYGPTLYSFNETIPLAEVHV